MEMIKICSSLDLLQPLKKFHLLHIHKIIWSISFYSGDNEEAGRGSSSRKQTRQEKMEVACPGPGAKN